MGFRNNAYAKVWETRHSEKYTDARISISRKTEDGYVSDFSGYVRLIGEAHTKALALHDGDRIKLISVDVSNNYNKEKKQTFTTFKVFDFETQDGGSIQPASGSTEWVNVPEGENEELPFGD